MNTLKYFHMTQSGDTLTLIANNQFASDAALTPSHPSDKTMAIDSMALEK